MKIAKNSKEARELVMKSKEGDVIVWDEAGKLKKPPINTSRIKEYFNQIWKVKLLKDMEKFEEEFPNSTVTRSCKADTRRTLNYIEYGFKEGIKFMEEEK